MITSKIATYVRFVGLIFLGMTVLVAPWCYGSIHASVQQWLFWGVGLSLICGMVALCLDWKTSYRFPVLFIPILLIILLVGQQLRPHEQAELAKRSPKVAELREQLLPAPDSSEYEFTKALCPSAQSCAAPAPTSIYPAATRHQLSLFVLAISVFVAASLLFRNRLSIIVFSLAAIGNGFLLALLGIIMRLSPHDSFFFFYHDKPGVYGAFLNRNNAAGYLGMCLGLAVLFLLWFIFRTDEENDAAKHWDRRFERAYLTFRQRILYRFVRYLNPGFLTAGLGVVVIIAGIFISMSRGGMLAMFTALVLGGLVIFSTRRFRMSLIGLAVVAVIGIALVFWAGMNERVLKRIESIVTADNSARPTNWSNAIETARDFHWRGAGFGTYQYANLLNDEFSKTNRIFVRAENQYIEIFLDLGPWGLALFLLCLVVTMVLCWRLIWQRKDIWLTALGGGLFIAVLTQVFASLFDFGLYIVANAMLLAVLCGILSAVPIPRKDKNKDDNVDDNAKELIPQFSWATLAQQIGMLICAGVVLGLLGKGHKEIKSIYHIDAAIAEIEAETSQALQDVSSGKLADATARLDDALRVRPDDAISRGALAEAQIRLFRLATWESLKAAPSQLSDAEKWNRTSLKSLHANLGMFHRLSLKTPARTIRENPAVEKYLNPAFENLVLARQSNLMFYDAHFRIAELIPLLDHENNQLETADVAIERMTKVAPLSSAVWYEAGILKKNIGHSMEARHCWKQSLSLSHIYLARIVRMTQVDMRNDNADALFQNTFPDSPEIFQILVNRYFTQQTSPDFCEQALEAFRRSIETSEEVDEGERRYYRGCYYILTQQYENAIAELLLACQAHRSKHEWRYQLARAYFYHTEYDKAKKEMDFVLFCAPENSQYRRFMDDVKKKLVTE